MKINTRCYVQAQRWRSRWLPAVPLKTFRTRRPNPPATKNEHPENKEQE